MDENYQLSEENQNSLEEGKLSFEDLGLDEYALRAVEKKGFITPSPIQVLAIPRLLDGDANLIARARTGTGKTAAFGLPIIQNVRGRSEHVEALILEPTRELAVQTKTEMQSFSIEEYPRTTVLYGGASYTNQIKDLKRGCEIVVGTPGRIKDHIERKTLDISKIKYFILDEGDEMLDMGFIDDIEEIFRHANPNCRILLFSATMPSPILKIAGDFMGEYEIIEEEKVIDEALLIDQKYWVVKESEKIEALIRLIDISPDFYGLVFTMTKSDADRVTRELDLKGYEAAALHGDIMQNQREKVLERFRLKKTRILVATDVAARGIDISGLTHVVNYSLPFDTATYVHRIGRTGRAGTRGIAITFVRPEERRKLGFLSKNIKKATKSDFIFEKVPTVSDVLAVKKESVMNDLVEKLSLCENAPQIFTDMAEKLSGEKDAKNVLASLLLVIYGKKLSSEHYGKITTKEFTSTSDQMRIFVSLGKKDGYHAKEIAEFFSKLLHIPNKMVDDIDVAQQFSLLSLPIASAKKAVQMSKENKKLPHMHIDVKEEGRLSRRGGKSNFSGSKEKSETLNLGDSKKSKTERNFGNERDFDFSKKSNNKKKSNHNVHVQTERSSSRKNSSNKASSKNMSSAAAYKKSKGSVRF